MPAFLSDSIGRGLSGDFQKTPLSPNVGCRRTLAAATSSAESPFTIRLADPHHPAMKDEGAERSGLHT